MGFLKLMTYNVYSGRTLDKRYDLAGKIEAIRTVSPDILGLNEVHRNTNHSNFTSQTDVYADALGYPFRYFARAIDHDGGEYGISLLSRLPFVSCRTVPVPDVPHNERVGAFEPRVHIDAVLNADGKEIRVLTSHYGLSDGERSLAVSETLRLAKPDLPAVFMGDLNAEPDDPVLLPLLNRFQDTGAYACDKIETFRSDAPDRRIDYIFVTRDFEVIRMFVPAVTESDHRPVVAHVMI